MHGLARYARQSDVGQLLEIEKDGFPTNRYATPFKRDISNKGISLIVAVDLIGQEYGWPSKHVDQFNKVNNKESSVLWRIYNFFMTDLLGRYDANSGDRLAAYISTWFMSDEAHITGIAVRSDFRGQGLGELMLISSIHESIRRRSSAVTLEVRVSNYIAQALYKKYGFKEVGVRKRYYTDNHEDAYIMTTDLIDSDEYGENFNNLVCAYRDRYPKLGLIGD
tara:strand:+ start:2088 stop:2753 length:666 start_codon:yes stop_codon:yes gene_type:complete